ncbi:MAG: NAD(P)-dependent oxidoreductase [Candidatus Bathyarchaeia archaeon]
MKVLVTGASGFVGSFLVERLKREKYEVVGTVRDVNRAVMSEGVTWCIGDLSDPVFVNRVVAEYTPDAVFHIAAKAIVTTAEQDIVDTYRSNVIGTANLLEACSKLKNRVWVFLLSTDKVLGEGDNAKEDKPYPERLGHYARSKMMQELLFKEYSDRLSTLILRSCNVIGERDTHRRIVPNTIRAALSGESPIVYREKPPSHRQYIYVSDLIDAIMLLFEMRETGVYHVGTPNIKTQEEVVLEILKHFPNVKPKYVEREHGIEIVRQSLNYDKIQSLGWKPKVTFEEAIERTVEWWKKRWAPGTS